MGETKAEPRKGKKPTAKIHKSSTGAAKRGGEGKTVTKTNGTSYSAGLPVGVTSVLIANEPTPVGNKPFTDDQLGALPGVPTEAELRQALAKLPKASRTLAAEILELVARELSSDAAARVWFMTSGGAFAEPPIELIQAGKADTVLAHLKSQAGPGAAYA